MTLAFPIAAFGVILSLIGRSMFAESQQTCSHDQSRRATQIKAPVSPNVYLPCRGDVSSSSRGVANEWSAPCTGSSDISNVPSKRRYHAAATYGRHQEDDADKRDVKGMVIFGGEEDESLSIVSDTWLYYPTINSWIRPSLDAQPGKRKRHTMTTICDNLVVLFGGEDLDFQAFNDTWIFDGVTESWTEIRPRTTSRGIKRRTYHSAVAVHRHLSPCRCKDSVVIFGGVSSEFEANYYGGCFTDIWELRCVDDTHTDKVYQWIPLQLDKTNSSFAQIPRLSPTVFPSLSGTSLYVWGGIDCGEGGPFATEIRLYDMWAFNLTSNTFHLVVDTTISYTPADAVAVNVSNPKDAPGVSMEIDGREFGVAIAGWQTKIIDFQTGVVRDPFSSTRYSSINLLSSGASAVEMEGAIIAFGGSSSLNTVPYPTVWNLSYTGGQWAWFPAACPINSPQGRLLLQGNTAVAGDSVYIFGGLISEHPRIIDGNHGRPAFNDVWELELLSSKWWRSWSLFSPGSLMLTASAVVDNDIVIFYGGSTDVRLFGVVHPRDDTELTPLNATWGYHTRLRRWTLYQYEISPLPRVSATLTALHNRSLLLFGGLSNGQPLNDLWLFTLCEYDVSKISRTCGRWLQLSGNRSVSRLDQRRYPGPRYEHSAVRVGGNVVIVGGTASSRSCLREMWLYSLSTGQWTSTPALGLPKPSMLSCRYLITSIGTKLLMTYQNWTIDSSVLVIGRVDVASSWATYSFDSNLPEEGWTVQAGGPQFGVAAVVSWREIIIAVGPPDPEINIEDKNRMILSSMTPGCIAGHSSPSWNNVTCQECRSGSYASKGSSKCTACPNSLTTITNASTSLDDCICEAQYCRGHGTCHVIPRDLEIAPLCKCDTGYSGSQCQYPFLFIIVGASVASFIIVAGICFLVFKCLRYRKGKLALENELDRMKKVWSIGSDEIHVEEHVAMGGFGEVSRARYREMAVAVKMLQDDLICFVEEEKAFAREVEIMQTIRHPNIVLFLGAGKFPDGCPFIVLEFVSNGTVRSLLDDPSVSINYSQSIKFAIDAAKGMAFLHGLVPPRIHRDVKSLNLLITQDWVVKVADFGTSRVVQFSAANLRSRRKWKKGKNRKTDTFELSQLSSNDWNAPLLSENVGTRQWQAPETIGHRTRYGLPADVYR